MINYKCVNFEISNIPFFHPFLYFVSFLEWLLHTTCKNQPQSQTNIWIVSQNTLDQHQNLMDSSFAHAPSCSPSFIKNWLRSHLASQDSTSCAIHICQGSKNRKLLGVCQPLSASLCQSQIVSVPRPLCVCHHHSSICTTFSSSTRASNAIFIILCKTKVHDLSNNST